MKLNEITGTYCRSTFYSLTEFAEYAESFAGQYGSDVYHYGMDYWYFGSDDTRDDYRDAFKMAREGWDYHLETALALTDQVIETLKDETRDDFRPRWDFTGSQVDIGAYLTGEPECMIDYPPTEITKAGRVITLCVALSVSSSMSSDEMVRRGVMVTALAEMLSQRGLNTEIWVDISYDGNARYSHSQRVLIKGTNDVIDNSRILYAFANPSMFRVLSFAAALGLPDNWIRMCGVGNTYGTVGTTKRDLEEGTLYLGTRGSARSFDMAAELRSHLKTLGLLED